MAAEYLSLFKAYDVRGTYPTINKNVAYWVGFSLVKEILEKENLPLKVNIVHDHRNSSNELYQAIYNGIKDAGGEPVALGLGSTDMLYAACQFFETAGVMITASHNPPADNGIKIVKKIPQMLGIGTGLEIIRDSEYIQNLKEVENLIDVVENDNAKEELINFYKSKIQEIGSVDNIRPQLAEKKLNVVVDTGNGIGGYIMKFIQDVYPEINFIPLFWELDGNYPNHIADPLKDENVVDLKKAVVENKADFGIAFDGDADRAFFIDENGNRVIGDFLVATFGKYMLEQRKNGKPSLNSTEPTVVYNYPASRCTKEVAEENGGHGAESKQGHNYIKAKMFETKAVYGGEHSGHNYFAEFACMDSGTMSAALFINMLLVKNVTASELTLDLAKKYLLSGEKNFKLEEQMEVSERLKLIENKLREVYPDGDYEFLDGITLLYPGWKVNIRLSNTEPLLRINLEIKNISGDVTQQDVTYKLEEIKKILGL